MAVEIYRKEGGETTWAAIKFVQEAQTTDGTTTRQAVNNGFVRREFFQKKKKIIIIIIIIMKGSKSCGGDIKPNMFLAHTPVGAESDLNAAAAAPSQTDITDLNCSDHSTT